MDRRAAAEMPRQDKGVISFEQGGIIRRVQLKISAYLNGNLAIEMFTWEAGETRAWKTLTANLGGNCQKDCAFVNVSENPDAPVWLIRHGLAIPTGVNQIIGNCKYLEYRFRAEKLRQADMAGYQEYLKIQERRYSA